MKLARTRLAPPLSLLTALAVVSVFTLSSFAAPEPPKPVDRTAASTFAADRAGTLTVAKGGVTVNGNAAATGATVLSGSVVATSADGRVILDFGTLGRVGVGHGMTVTVTCGSDLVRVQTPVAPTEVKVNRGEVNVGSEVIAAGEEKGFSGEIEAVATGGADFAIGPQDPSDPSQQPPPSKKKKGPGWLAWLTLIGIGAGVATGIAVGGGGGEAAATRPSAVVP